MTKRQPKSVAYTFAHLFLPIIALGNPKEFHRKLSKKSGTKYLVQLWKRVEWNTRSKGSHVGLAVSKAASARGRISSNVKKVLDAIRSTSSCLGVGPGSSAQAAIISPCRTMFRTDSDRGFIFIATYEDAISF